MRRGEWGTIEETGNCHLFKKKRNIPKKLGGQGNYEKTRAMGLEKEWGGKSSEGEK